MAGKYYVGFDLGGKNIRVVMANEEGKFAGGVLREENDISRGPIGTSCQMLELMKRCALEEKISLSDVAAVGISSAGPLDLKRFEGSIRDSTNIKFSLIEEFELNNLPKGYLYNGKPLIEIEEGKRHVCIPLVGPIKDFLNVPVYLGNDVNTACIGVVMFGEGTKYGNPKDMNYTAVVTTHGAGFGAGVWTRGGVLEGVDGNAAECGHYKVIEDGRKCGCGHEGCAETFGSGTGIASNAIKKILAEPINKKKERGLDSFTSDYPHCEVYMRAMEKMEDDVPFRRFDIILNYIDAKLVFDVYRKSNGKDKVAREVIEEAGKYIGRAYGAIACSYNPYFIATYGGVTKNWDLLEERVLNEMKNCTNVRIPDVFVTELGDDAGLHGAVGRAIGYGR